MMECFIIKDIEQIPKESLIIDSAKWKRNDLKDYDRIDHHITLDWVNLDTLYKTYDDGRFNQIILSNKRIISSYLDPDAIISAGVIKATLDNNINLIDFRNSDLGKILYSASFYCDYNSSFDKFPDNINLLGHKLETFLRYKMEIEIGEDRGKKLTKSDLDISSSFFEKYSFKIAKMIISNSLHEDVLAFDDVGYINDMASYIVNNTQKISSEFGLIISNSNDKRLIPRAYYKVLNKQIIVMRVIDNIENSSCQIFVGVNPLIKNWTNFNCKLLADKILNISKDWELKGRRNIIAIREKNNYRDLIDIVKSLNYSDCFDECNLVTIYNNG